MPNQVIKAVSLYFCAGTSDKEYHAQLEKNGSGYVVNFQYGRRGSTLQTGTKTKSPVPLEDAENIFDKLVSSKMAKGYTEGESGTPYTGTPKEKKVTGMVPQLLNPIDEDEVVKYLKDPSWGAQEKKDGKHIMISRKGSDITASNRKGLEVAIPETVVESLEWDGDYDGEMIGDVFHAFDLVEEKTCKQRHADLSKIEFGHCVKVVPLAVTEKDKRELFERLKKENKEGIVFKKLDSMYVPGRPASGGDMLKCKFYATCSCIVTKGRKGKRSVGMLLMNEDGDMVNVGNVTVPANQSIPKEDEIIEVRYLYAYKNGSLYQPTLLGVRDDIDIEDCSLKQLKYKAEED